MPSTGWAASIFERWGHLDGLIGNAGVLGTLSPVAHLEPKDFDQAYAVNVTANYRMIRSLDALLRQADAGRAVFVSSGAAHGVRPFWGLYGATKSALETMIRSYADELGVSKAKANIFNPGRLRTAMHAKAFPGEDPDDCRIPSAAAPALIDMIEPATTTGMLFEFSGRRDAYPLDLRDQHLVDAAAVEVDDLEAPRLADEALAGHRQMVQLGEHIAGDRLVFRILGDRNADLVGKLVDRHPARHQI